MKLAKRFPGRAWRRFRGSVRRAVNRLRRLAERSTSNRAARGNKASTCTHLETTATSTTGNPYDQWAPWVRILRGYGNGFGADFRRSDAPRESKRCHAFDWRYGDFFLLVRDGRISTAKRTWQRAYGVWRQP